MKLNIVAIAILARQAVTEYIGHQNQNENQNQNQNEIRDTDTDFHTLSITPASAASSTTPVGPSQFFTLPTTTATASKTSTTTVATQTVAVGATGFTFTPDSLVAAVGSVVEFNFYPGNHSVVRSAYKFPCIPFEYSGPNRVGFFSGFLDTNVYSSDGPKYQIRINDTEPIFYYCSAPSSCLGNAMIGVINPNSTWTLEVQEEFTANTTIQLSPGDPLPSEVGSSPTATGSSASGSATAAPAVTHKVGEIVGIAVGVVAAALAALAIAGWCCVRRNPYLQRRLRERRQRSQGQGGGSGGGGGGNGNGNGGDGHDPDGIHSQGNLLSPMMSPSMRQTTPGSRDSVLNKFGNPTPPPTTLLQQQQLLNQQQQQQQYAQGGGGGLGIGHHRLPPSVVDMAEYFAQPNYRHRTPPPLPNDGSRGGAGAGAGAGAPLMPPMTQQMAQMPMPYPQYHHLPHQYQPQPGHPHQPQQQQHYYAGLPIYASMTHSSSTPLGSHPVYDRGPPAAAPAAASPVELPTSVTQNPNSSADVSVAAQTMRVRMASSPQSPPRNHVDTLAQEEEESVAPPAGSIFSPALKDSPTIGVVARPSWEGNGRKGEKTEPAEI